MKISTCTIVETKIQWNLSNLDTIGPEKSVLIKRGVLISEVEMYANTVFGEGKCVLFREVSLIQGVLCREVPLYTDMVSHEWQIIELTPVE